MRVIEPGEVQEEHRRFFMTMKKMKKKSGIHWLLKKYRTLFRIPENQNHHSGEDYRKAERMFLEHALEQRRIEMQDDLFK